MSEKFKGVVDSEVANETTGWESLANTEMTETETAAENKEPEEFVFLQADRTPEKYDNDNYFIYSLSAEKKAAVPKEQAVGLYAKKVLGKKSEETFTEGMRLGLLMKKDDVFKDAIEYIENQPVYKYNRAKHDRAQTARLIEKDQAAYDQQKNNIDIEERGGILHRLTDRREIKAKEERLKEFYTRLEKHREDLAKYDAQITEYLDQILGNEQSEKIA